MNNRDRHTDTGGRRRRAGERQAGLAMIGRSQRWMTGGALVLAGGLSALTAHAFHAHAAAASRSAVARPAPARAAHHDADGTGPGLTPPATGPTTTPAPSTTPAPAPAAPVSGGS